MLKEHENPTKTSTPLHTTDWYVKWVATVILIVGMILTANNVDISGQPAGTSMVWKVATTSQSVSKQTRIHGVSLGWS